MLLLLLLLVLQLQALVETTRAGVPIEEGVVSQASLLLIFLSAACGIEHPRGCKKWSILSNFVALNGTFIGHFYLHQLHNDLEKINYTN